MARKLGNVYGGPLDGSAWMPAKTGEESLVVDLASEETRVADYRFYVAPAHCLRCSGVFKPTNYRARYTWNPTGSRWDYAGRLRK